MAAALLDTNAVSDLMRDHPQVKARVAAHPDLIATSVVVAGEIRYGLERLPVGKRRTDLESRAQTVLGAIAIEPVGELIADGYGRLKASLESQGASRDDNDLWIAATAITLGYTLVTRDKSFAGIPGLQVEDWSV
jgi:predicted nucleic acid-binding protein